MILEIKHSEEFSLQVLMFTAKVVRLNFAKAFYTVTK